MPWFNLRAMSDTVLSALYRYIQAAGPAGEPAPAWLRALIVEAAKSQRAALIEARVKLHELAPATSAESLLLRNEFAQLPGEVANELLLNVLPAEQQLASEQGQLSLRLKQTAREALHEWRITRAWEGLYLPANANLDSYRLALHSLEKLPGWSPEVRLEIRNLAFDGVLIDSVGAPAATVRWRVWWQGISSVNWPGGWVHASWAWPAGRTAC